MTEHKVHKGRTRITVFIVTAAVLLTLPLVLVAVQQNQEIRQRAATVQAPVTVEIVDFRFNPGTITVPAGTTVTWVNHSASGTNHTSSSDVTNSPQSWDSQFIARGDSFSKTFTVVGNYKYHCNVHGAAKMSGTVNVVAAADQPPVLPSNTIYQQPTVAPTTNPYNNSYPSPKPTNTPYNPYPPTPTTNPYVAPTSIPYTVPTTNPYNNNPYVSPTTNPYNNSYVAPTTKPYGGYIAPTTNPYNNNPYVAPTTNPYKANPYAAPTFYCLAAPCPGEPTATPPMAHAPVVYVTAPPQQQVVVPPSNPCTTVGSSLTDDTSDTNKSKHHKHKGDISNGTDGLLQMFMQLINLLLQLLGQQPIPQPQPAPLPNPQVNPCPPVLPTGHVVLPVPSGNATPSAVPVPSSIVVVPSTIVAPSIAVPSAPATPSMIVPSQAPCGTSTTSLADDQTGNGRPISGGGFLQQLLEFFMRIFDFIFRFLGLNTGNPQPQPIPVPTVQPAPNITDKPIMTSAPIQPTVPVVSTQPVTPGVPSAQPIISPCPSTILVQPSTMVPSTAVPSLASGVTGTITSDSTFFQSVSIDVVNADTKLTVKTQAFSITQANESHNFSFSNLKQGQAYLVSASACHTENNATSCSRPIEIRGCSGTTDAATASCKITGSGSASFAVLQSSTASIKTKH